MKLAQDNPNLQEITCDYITAESEQQPFDLRNVVQLGASDLAEINPTVCCFSPAHVSVPSFDSGNRLRPLSESLPLYKAAVNGDWKRTALHVAAAAGHAKFVEELVQLMQSDALELRETNNGETALHLAAIAGHTKVAKAMLQKNPNLTQLRNVNGWTPLLSAIYSSSKQPKEMIEYLCSVTIDGDSINNPLVGGELICTIARAGLYDIAMNLIQQNPDLAILKDESGCCALEVMAERPYAFPSSSQLRPWQRFIYPFITVESSPALANQVRADLENPLQISGELSTNITTQSTTKNISVIASSIQVHYQRIKELLLKVRGIKQVYDEKLMHKQALDLVKCICAQIFLMSCSGISDFFKDSSTFTTATIYGTVEVVLECIQMFPDLIWLKSQGRSIFEIAIEERHEQIFNLVLQMNEHKKKLVYSRDEFGNTILHLAAKLSPSSQLHSVTCVALQMQRELQWFEAVENITLPIHKVTRNNDGKTPGILFKEQHHALMEKGEKWMKDTAQSCMLVATLIATVVFAAAFQVPGGNFSNDDGSNKLAGFPIFLRRNAFMVFAVADALAFFSSSTSILMFLSILTSRYAEQDFLNSLPKRLIIGLATLFFSIITMMVAFSATLSISLGPKFGWVPIPLALSACVPVTLFAFLQYPLFFEIVYSTYGPGIFHK
ncbi:hypothetical protein MKW98_010154 [Papaver atlanticum]|uniref:PGG domain-containing protein n=1 Tax=Papaver atlanticum TaxID=357466 RepID=A0AAD4X4C3_9MAGN|nr:hypothetical protein MKW98_010154 [Papaver atlanticum]